MDADRTLTDEGLHQAKLMRRFRKSMGIKWDIAFSSDFQRATETMANVKNRKAPWYMLKELRPNGTAEDAYKAIFGCVSTRSERIAELRVLVVTHDPLINKMAAAVCFGFSPDINNFSHGSMLRVDTHPIDAEKHPLHWLVGPSLFESLEDGDLIEAAVNLSENLRQSAKARVVDPLISKLQKAVARRFRAQARDYHAIGALFNSDAKFSLSNSFDRVTYNAYIAGAAMVHAQIGKVEEADRKKVLLPVAIATALSTYERTGADLEREIDETSALAIGKLIADQGGEDAGAVAKLIASWAKDRAETIATTEVSAALHAGMADAATVIGQQQGVEVEKAWNVEDDPCEICLGNVDDGWIPDDILFASGDDGPPQHPNCRCSLSYRTQGGGE